MHVMVHIVYMVFLSFVCILVCAGDITTQGFEKKKAKLLAPYLSPGKVV